MTNPGRPQPAGPNPTVLFSIVTAVVTMIVALYVVTPRSSGEPAAVEAAGTEPSFGEPIPAEAQVFRTRSGFAGTAPDAEVRSDARPRSLAFYRRLRAYPGAPPRVPHGLTEEEFRTGSCKVCHERGGYAARFGAYAPVTPHPEYTACLQCHVPEAMSVGVPLPGARGEVVCRQCHVDPDRPPPSLVSMDWVPAPWPALRGAALPGGPPVIPHPLQQRGDCLACHAGPAAVRELRTRHPERANCRQCHVAQEAAELPAPSVPPPDRRASALP